MGDRRIIPPLMNPAADVRSLQVTLPVHLSLELAHKYAGQANEAHGWSYCLPCVRQACTPGLKSGFKEKLPATPYGNKNEAIVPKVETGCSQKRFLVFDQSGDQTTLIFSSVPSGFGATVPCFASCGLKTPKDNPEPKENLNVELRQVSPEKFDQNDKTDLQSEMHEDTDELNALLYSDDDSDYAEDDEVTSTGHSPSTMTFLYDQDCFNGSTEEVASSGGSTKKRKFLDEGGYLGTPDMADTASSIKHCRSLEYEDDAESRCDDGSYRRSDKMGSGWSNKKMREERIQETLSILQDIIPGGKGKNAMVVLDEAISYVKSLKGKAKSLGLHVA